MSLNVAVSSYDNIFAYVNETANAGSISNFGVVANDNVIPYNNVFAEYNVLSGDRALTHFWLCRLLPLRFNPCKVRRLK
jgi:hypothetical protein